ncbi:MAG TPA: class I SAM-dependent methyltransferase [Sphingomonas sp.]|nr:class I SAM-dependent methyltransferase [Sphingomonas sp.]
MQEQVVDHYQRHAEAFDAARRTSFAERPWFDRFLLAVPGGAHVLDLGCGAGEPVAHYLIEAGLRITGIDASAAMLAKARTRFPEHLWIEGDMRSAAPPRRFHGVIAWDSLFHLPPAHQAGMIERMARWLEPGGALLFNSGDEANEMVGEQFGEPLYHASLAPADYRALFDQAGLVETAFALADPLAGGRTIWLARKAG